MLRLAQSGGKTTVTELWYTNRMRIHIGNALRLGGHVYGSSGDFGPAFVTAVDVGTGQVAWQDRAFSKASFVHADGKAVVVDEDGNLALATLSPKGLTVHSRADVLSTRAWTVPTLVGTMLYVRDRAEIKAFDLS
jgi:hypothetical protein